jgi:hypothetical protein
MVRRGAHLLLVLLVPVLLFFSCIGVHAHLFWYGWGVLLYGLDGLHVSQESLGWYHRVGGALSASCKPGGLLSAITALGAGVCKPGLLAPGAAVRAALGAHVNVTLLNADPPVWQVDGLFDAPEAARMVDIGAVPGRMRAATAGTVFDDSKRNNKKMYLQAGWDGEPPVSAEEVAEGAELKRRVAAMAQLPPDHLEDLQIQRTLPGEFYHMHHDFDSVELLKPSGPRLWTVLLYCSTVTAGDGGETDFPLLGLKVRPVLGRAVFWPNVYEHTLVRDLRTMHASLLLERGEKHAVNLNAYPARYEPPDDAWGQAHMRFIEWVSNTHMDHREARRKATHHPEEL